MKRTFSIAAAAALVFGISAAPAQTVLFEEDFEGYAVIEDMLDEAEWSTLDQEANLEISDEQAWVGSQSLKFTGAWSGFVAGSPHATVTPQDIGEGDGAILVSAYFFDSFDPDNLGAQDFGVTYAGYSDGETGWAEGELDQLIAFGLSTLPSGDATSYAFRSPFGGSNWIYGDQDRVVGWVKLSMLLQDGTSTYYQDDVEVASDTFNVAGFNNLRLGQFSGVPHDFDVYLDGVEIIQGASDPTTVQEWHLY